MEKCINLTTTAHLIQGAFYLLLLLAVCVIPFGLAQRTTAKGERPANVITVTNTNDSGPGSLRQALADANAYSDFHAYSDLNAEACADSAAARHPTATPVTSAYENKTHYSTCPS